MIQAICAHLKSIPRNVLARRELVAVCRCWRKTPLCATERINRLFLNLETWAAQMATRLKKINHIFWVRCVWPCLWRPSISPSLQSFYFILDELSWVSFADENFQQSQFGFNMFVFTVLYCQRGAVLLLHISVGTSCEWKTTNMRKSRRFSRIKLITQHSFCYIIWTSESFLLPSILPKELVLKLFQVFADPLLLLSGLLELLHKFFPIRWGVATFKNLTPEYIQKHLRFGMEHGISYYL